MTSSIVAPHLLTMPMKVTDCFTLKQSSTTLTSSSSLLIQEDDLLIFYKREHLSIEHITAHHPLYKTPFSDLKQSCLLRGKGEIEPVLAFYMVKALFPSLIEEMKGYTFPFLNLSKYLREKTLDVPDWQTQHQMKLMFDQTTKWLFEKATNERKKAEVLEQMAELIATEILKGETSPTKALSWMSEIYHLEKSPEEKWEEEEKVWINPKGEMMVPLSDHLKKVAELEDQIRVLHMSRKSSFRP